MNRVKEITGLDTIDELLDELQLLKEEYCLDNELIESIRQRFDLLIELDIMLSNRGTARKNYIITNSKNIRRLKW